MTVKSLIQLWDRGSVLERIAIRLQSLGGARPQSKVDWKVVRQHEEGPGAALLSVPLFASILSCMTLVVMHTLYAMASSFVL